MTISLVVAVAENGVIGYGAIAAPGQASLEAAAISYGPTPDSRGSALFSWVQ